MNSGIVMEEIKVLVDNLKGINFLERDIKILAFVMFDYQFPVAPTPIIYEKNILRINKIYDEIKDEYKLDDLINPEKAFFVAKGGITAIETTIYDLLNEKHYEETSPRGISRKNPYKYLFPENKE